MHLRLRFCDPVGSVQVSCITKAVARPKRRTSAPVDAQESLRSAQFVAENLSVQPAHGRDRFVARVVMSP